MTQTTYTEEITEMSAEDRKMLGGLLGFAQGVLTAREKVQMTMNSGLGLFLEGDLAGLPGLHLDCEDGAWLRIDRQRETRPPEPAGHVATFMATPAADPARSPVMKPAVSLDVSIEEASDLEEGGLLRADNVHVLMENGVEVENRVKVILLAEDCADMRRDFERYIAGPWSDWARREKPIRKATSLYNNLFKIHSAIHTAEATPPELVWGLGIGRWEHKGARIDMPLLEQLVDIEVEDGGAISIRPRDLAPSLSLKPYLEIETDGAAKLQRELQSSLSRILDGDVEVSPFTTVWEPLLDTAAAQLSSTGIHISRAEIDEGATLPATGKDLRIASTWAIFGRPRSHEARSQDLEALRKQTDDETADVPPSIKGFSAPPPDTPRADTSDWGIDDAVLGGGGRNTWSGQSSNGGASVTREPSATPRDGKAEDLRTARRVHFFPLPFNEEQGRISDMIDDPKLHVACVSGPPGTGKSHSIANIISHQMATGKRVLVTARTPEAIAAVREKLPEALQPLVIASVGTDRDSAQQLQDAVSELSNEVVGLDTDLARAEKARLEQDIIDCDALAEKADLQLAEIARANLATVEWKGESHPPMEMVDLLAADEAAHGWFADRPEDVPAAQLADTLNRLRIALPQLAGDIDYAGVDLPSPDNLPGTADLLAAHETELAWNSREIVDYAGAPTMARDSAGAEEQARSVLAELEDCMRQVRGMSEQARALTVEALRDKKPITRSDIGSTLELIEQQRDLDSIAEVRFAMGDCDRHDFENAARRGAAGQKPVGFSLFGGALKAAVASVRVRESAPANSEDWRAVHDACHLMREKFNFSDALDPFVKARLAPGVPREPWDIAAYLKDRQAEMRAALELSARLTPVADALRSLFPYGLNVGALLERLDGTPAIFALKANLPNTYRSPDALTRLREIAGTSPLPVLSALRDLAGAIGQPGTDPQQIVALRGEITQELTRLAEVAPKLKALGADLDELCRAGAPDWAARLRDAPFDAAELIPGDWRSAWMWGVMTGRVARIVGLGNGDEHRRAKAEAMRRRRKLFEELIRIRTLLGLARRMTPRIRQAMEAFTQAVSKIGTGKGKKAPRFIRAAQEAARQASSAAPVWIMPEYKIPEQLPPSFGDFDLVILDEASQSDITALAALARGKKILVVGDEEQVSPTAVGIPVQKINALRAEFLDGLPNSGLIDENTSIFEITKRMHPESHVMLREHFRCVAPIIQFSTRFYNNALVPLRVPKASERFDPPLADVYIPGATRQGKTNPHEARWIVDEIARIVADPAHNGRDIGVISLIGNEQAQKIGRMLVEDERIGPEVIEKRRIIYGDARTMQGQERSIVFLSMVATPGRVTSQSSKADQQRINVAMSRARDRLYLVRSVSLDHLKPTDIKAQILHHFLDPMPDGRAGTGAESADLMDRCHSGFEREVLDMLLEANYRVRPQVKAGGFSIDLVVEGAEDRRLAIELDGDAFHGPEVWERDMARQAALERAGWTFWRVFGSQWRAQKDYWWRNLLETLAAMKIEPIGSAAIDERFTETILVDAFGDTETPIARDTTSGEASADGDSSPSSPAADVLPDPQDDDGAAAAMGPDRIVWAEPRSGTLPFPAERDLVHPHDAVSEAVTENGIPTTATADEASSAPSIRIGSTVRIEKLSNGGGKFEVMLVEDGHDAEQGLIGVHTPLGQALLDAQTGDDVEYRAGSHLQEVRVLAVD